jgi:hypothetical protein
MRRGAGGFDFLEEAGRDFGVMSLYFFWVDETGTWGGN